jgi:electron transport complex protein RnfB
MNADAASLAERIDAALPQTQCTRCGYPDCRGYAQAIASGEAAINRCPPGGAEGIARLAALTARPVLPLDTSCGAEGPLKLARIDEAWCIGCTLCIEACPVDCIVGAAKQMHTVMASDCTGCELCLPACPVDCIELVETGDARTGWAAWSLQRADAARRRYARHQRRRNGTAEPRPRDAPLGAEHKRSAVAAAMARARARRPG